MRIIFFIMAFLASSPAISKTLIIGDSVFALTKQVPNHLKKNGLQFDIRARSGSKIEGIAKQYQKYRDQHGIPDRVIMDGGGNNILWGHMRDCATGNNECADAVAEALQTLYSLWGDMAADGVSEVIHVGIHYMSDRYRAIDPVIDDAMAEAQVICKYVPGRCTFVDPRPAFRGKENSLLIFDGIHPNKKGSIIIADLILEALE